MLYTKPSFIVSANELYFNDALSYTEDDEETVFFAKNNMSDKMNEKKIPKHKNQDTDISVDDIPVTITNQKTNILNILEIN